MATFSISKKVLIFVNLAIYIVHLILNGLSASGKKGDLLFPNSVSDISETFNLELTPVGATFSIWGAIFTYELSWIIYTTTTVCRSNLPSANILSNRFFIAFILNIVFISTWLFLWARQWLIASFVVIALGQICVDTAIAFAICDLKKFTDEQKISNKNKVDVWCQRFLVQNGLIFYATWTTVATLINLAGVAAYRGNATTLSASIISLSLLTVLAITWFILESFVFINYTEYTFTAYITLIIANTGVFAANNKIGGNDTMKSFTLTLIILSALLLIVRLIIICVRHKKRSFLHTTNDPSTPIIISEV